MKKIFFLLFTVLLFTSCSQDESIQEAPNKDAKDSVAVVFKIGTPFSVEVENLKSSSLHDGEPLYFRYLVYDWNGNFNKEQLGDFTFYRNQGFEINDFLILGQYHIAIIASSDEYEIENFVPSKYYEDIYKQNSENSKIYYDTFDYNTSENYKSVTLSPMFIEIIVHLNRWMNGISEVDNISEVQLNLGDLGDAFNISTKKTVSSTFRGKRFVELETIPFFDYTTTCFAAEEGKEIYLKAHITKEGDDPSSSRDMFARIDAKRGQRAYVNGTLWQYVDFDVKIDDELEDAHFPIVPIFR